MRWNLLRRIGTEWRLCPDEGNDPTDSQTKEMNKMKVKQEYLAELREIFLESVGDSDSVKTALELLVRYLPKEGEISLSDFMQTELLDVFDYVWEGKSESEIVQDKLQQLWKDVGLADFAILNVRYTADADIDDDRNPQEIFFLVANELEILIDEADMKMQKFTELAEEILGFPMKYEFDDVSTGEKLGQISHIYGGAA